MQARGAVPAHEGAMCAAINQKSLGYALILEALSRAQYGNGCSPHSPCPMQAPGVKLAPTKMCRGTTADVIHVFRLS